MAILVDAGYYRAQWHRQKLVPATPSAHEVLQSIDQIRSVVQSRHTHCDVRLLRTYYYDAEPFGGTRVDPAGVEIDFSASAQFRQQIGLLNDLRLADNIAIRKGQLKFRGWDSTRAVPKFKPLFVQKGVDMKIGLDVAWMSTKGIVDIIVLVTADTDFIAPMKLARTEGVEVWLYTLNTDAAFELVEHADVYVKGGW